MYDGRRMRRRLAWPMAESQTVDEHLQLLHVCDARVARQERHHALQRRALTDGPDEGALQGQARELIEGGVDAARAGMTAMGGMRASMVSLPIPLVGHRCQRPMRVPGCLHCRHPGPARRHATMMALHGRPHRISTSVQIFPPRHVSGWQQRFLFVCLSVQVRLAVGIEMSNDDDGRVMAAYGPALGRLLQLEAICQGHLERVTQDVIAPLLRQCRSLRRALRATSAGVRLATFRSLIHSRRRYLNRLQGGLPPDQVAPLMADHLDGIVEGTLRWQQDAPGVLDALDAVRRDATVNLYRHGLGDVQAARHLATVAPGDQRHRVGLQADSPVDLASALVLPLTMVVDLERCSRGVPAVHGKFAHLLWQMGRRGRPHLQDLLRKAVLLSVQNAVQYGPSLLGASRRRRFRMAATFHGANGDLIVYAFDDMVMWCEAKDADAIIIGHAEVGRLLLHSQSPVVIGIAGEAHRWRLADGHNGGPWCDLIRRGASAAPDKVNVRGPIRHGSLLNRYPPSELTIDVLAAATTDAAADDDPTTSRVTSLDRVVEDGHPPATIVVGTGDYPLQLAECLVARLHLDRRMAGPIAGRIWRLVDRYGQQVRQRRQEHIPVKFLHGRAQALYKARRVANECL